MIIDSSSKKHLAKITPRKTSNKFQITVSDLHQIL